MGGLLYVLNCYTIKYEVKCLIGCNRPLNVESCQILLCIGLWELGLTNRFLNFLMFDWRLVFVLECSQDLNN